MVSFGHTAVGAAVGLYGLSLYSTGNPILGLVATGAIGVASHYAADLIPHGHFIKFKDYKKKVGEAILFDFLLSVLIFSVIAFYKFGFEIEFLYILFGIGGAQLPDILDGLIYTKKIPNKGLIKIENNIHIATHWHGKAEKALMWSKADIWQVLVFISAVIYLLSF